MHSFICRVYYEDTDMAGIVYYANYFKFIERARSEWVRSLGVDQGKLKEEDGIVFAVRRVEADYLRSAVFDDELTITTEMKSLSPARIILEQIVRRESDVVFQADVTLVAMTENGKPTRLPSVFRQFLA